jgi:putative Mg2+ transporter-C (MgtC) family protein
LNAAGGTGFERREILPLQPSWQDIAVRLALTMLAAGVIGFDREARGHAAGFRTTILVGLAASVGMIQANLLLPLTGKTPQSFAVMDLMRLPLGILTGVGFIGGGAILRRGDLLTGVTTAATLWLVTVIGLCFGGGQLILGIAATILAVLTLWTLKRFDGTISRRHRARLVIAGPDDWRPVESVLGTLKQLNCSGRFQAQHRNGGSATADYTFDLTWTQPAQAPPPLDLMQALSRDHTIVSFSIIADR